MDVRPLPKTPRLPKSIEDGTGTALIKQLYKSFVELTATVNALVSKAESTLKKLEGVKETGEAVGTRVGTLEALTTVEGWNAATFANGWVNYDNGYNPAGYYKDGAGVVHLRGLVKSGTAQAIFTLPAGYRPPYIELWTSSSAGVFCRIDVHPTGAVIWVAGGSNTWVSLDGISFRAA